MHSRLSIYHQHNAEQPLLVTETRSVMRAKLSQHGIIFEQWPLQGDSVDLLKAYQAPITELQATGGYQTVDVISLTANHPDKDQLRQNFVEHTHSEDEVLLQ